jgi:hypothetical protein
VPTAPAFVCILRAYLFCWWLHTQQQIRVDPMPLCIACHLYVALANSDTAGCITRDPRKVERKKPGHIKARKMPTWVKR